MRLRPGTEQLLVGGLLIGVITALALLAMVWTPHDPAALNVAGRLAGPGIDHWLGTDYLGRDLASMVMAGASSSLGTAVAAVGLGAVVGIPLGLLAALGGRIADAVARGLIDLFFAFPVVLTALVLLALNGPGLLNAVLAIAVFNATVFARITRSTGRAVASRDFVRAAHAAGRGTLGIAWGHVLPNIRGVLLVQTTVLLSVGILAEAGLTYLGVGAQPPQPTWGKMLLDAQVFMQLDPRQAIVPGSAIALSVLGLNLLGDGLRDRFDRRLPAGIPATGDPRAALARRMPEPQRRPAPVRTEAR